MSWIVIALISIVWSVSLYLFLRLLKKQNISPKTQNAIMFIPTTLIFWLWAYFSGQEMWIWWDMLGIMVPCCILFSWLANLASLISMQHAPNIGYSLMISKSYVVIATLLAIPFFWSYFSWVDWLAIVMIVWCMSLILIEPWSKKSGNNSNNKNTWWIFPALYACVGRAGLSLSSTYFIRSWIDPLVVNFWIFLIVSLVMIWDILIKREKNFLSSVSIRSVLWVVVSMMVFNWSLQAWYKVAPNPWYINAANTSSIAILTLISSWIFWDDLSRKKIYLNTWCNCRDCDIIFILIVIFCC